MTVTAESYEAGSLGLAVSMLAACARFQSCAGAADATAALGFIVESTSGTPGMNAGVLGNGTAVNGAALDLEAPFYAIVGLPDGVTSSAGGAGGWDDREFSIGIRLVHHRKKTGESAPDGARRAFNDHGVIRAQLEAQKGSSAALADFEVSSSGLFMDEEGVHRDHIITELTITARG